MKIRYEKLVSYLVVAMMAGTCLGFGSWFHDSSKRETKTVMLAQTTRFKNGAVLPAGEYRMEFSKDTQTPNVQFFKVYTNPYTMQAHLSNDVVASIKANLVTTNTKNANTEVISTAHGNVQVVQSILPKGSNERLVFNMKGGKTS